MFAQSSSLGYCALMIKSWGISVIIVLLIWAIIQHVSCKCSKISIRYHLSLPFYLLNTNEATLGIRSGLKVTPFQGKWRIHWISSIEKYNSMGISSSIIKDVERARSMHSPSPIIRQNRCFNLMSATMWGVPNIKAKQATFETLILQGLLFFGCLRLKPS